MREQFATFEISLQLKELGFDEQCLAFFRNDQYHDLCCACEPAMDGDFTVYVPFEGFKDTLAPLWQQVIDFLKSRKVLVTERWDGWEYGAFEWDDFIYCESKEQAILKAIELIQKK